jgi:hypothetical protein
LLVVVVVGLDDVDKNKKRDMELLLYQGDDPRNSISTALVPPLGAVSIVLVALPRLLVSTI